MSNHSLNATLPWDCRDKDDLAREAYETPARRKASQLEVENLKLKKLLREHGISWSPLAYAHLQQVDPRRRRTRLSMPSNTDPLPVLPTEVLLRIAQHALKSSDDIIDPLWPRVASNMTAQEKERGVQVAINLLATCKALHTEGTRMLWESNNFIFTSHSSLRHFSELDYKYRVGISHITMRVIARHYDDLQRRHRFANHYHSAISGKNIMIPIHRRPKGPTLTRGGYRCYSWSQIADFLTALRPPFDPSHRAKDQPMPKLLPSLTSIRMDLVNFTETSVPMAGAELHEIASHEMCCTLNELQITGMPLEETGYRVAAELSGLLKDEGLLLDGAPAFFQRKRGLECLPGVAWSARVIRACKADVYDEEQYGFDFDDEDSMDLAFGLHRTKLGHLPPAPTETGHPESHHNLEKVIWKRVPARRDGLKREWKLFSRLTGREADLHDVECPNCGGYHAQVHDRDSFSDSSFT